MARKMKDSGIEWIGIIPFDWNIVRMKNCISGRCSGAWGDEANGEEGDTICLRIADFDYDNFVFKNIPEEELTKRNYDKSTIEKLLLSKDDILIEKSGGGEKTPVGRTVIFDKDYNALFANFMDRLRCSDIVIPKFMQYIFVTFYKNSYSKNYIKQTTGIQNLDLTSMLSKENVVIPSIKEQQLIADYLDTKVAKIDEAISKTRSTIDEYKALKQSIITKAVTKGVRGDRPMKDSGIEWIGEIPEEWDISKLKFECSVVRGGSPRPIEKYISDDGNGYNWIKIGDTEKGSKYITHCRQKIIADGLNKTRLVNPGSLLLTNSMSFGEPYILDIEGCIHDGWLAFSDYNSIEIEYLYYTLVSDLCKRQFAFSVDGGVVQNLNIDKVKNSIVFLPEIIEQLEIVRYLDSSCYKIDTIISKKEQLITELESYKKSLIYEYVTGKKEVPGYGN